MPSRPPGGPGRGAARQGRHRQYANRQKLVPHGRSCLMLPSIGLPCDLSESVPDLEVVMRTSVRPRSRGVFDHAPHLLISALLAAALPSGLVLAGPSSRARKRPGVFHLAARRHGHQRRQVLGAHGLAQHGRGAQGHRRAEHRPPPPSHRYRAAENATEPIPNDRNHLHFGAGETEARIELPPGTHTLQLLLGDKDHIPHNPPIASKKITVIVK
jgi:hypothetical protein